MNDGRAAALVPGATSDIGRAIAHERVVNEAEPSPTRPLGGGLSCGLAL